MHNYVHNFLTNLNIDMHQNNYLSQKDLDIFINTLCTNLYYILYSYDQKIRTLQYWEVQILLQIVTVYHIRFYYIL